MAVVDELVTLLSFKTSPGTEKAIKSIKDGISTLKKRDYEVGGSSNGSRSSHICFFA